MNFIFSKLILPFFKPIFLTFFLMFSSFLTNDSKSKDLYCNYSDTDMSIDVCDFLNKKVTRYPNIVVIVADDLGWGDLSVYGNPRATTPNLQRLAKSGVVFTNFYVAAPVCSPSRAGFMTGVSPLRLGITDTLHEGGKNALNYNTVHYLDPNIPTLTSTAKKGGYLVGHFGKWHLGSGKLAPPLESYGIDEHFTYASPHIQQEIIDSEKSDPHHFGKLDGMLFDRAIDFIERSIDDDKPFLVNIWAHTPHTPLQPTEIQLEEFRKSLGEVNPFSEFIQRSQSDIIKRSNTPAEIYYAAIHELDKHVGLLIDFLKDNSIINDTIIIFFSDNGPEKLTQSSISNQVMGNTGPFRGRKFSIYEGGIRVPAIVSWPGIFGENLVDSSSIVSSLDFMRTLGSIAGLEVPSTSIDSENVISAFLGLGHDRENDLFWFFPKTYSVWGPAADMSPTLAIRRGPYKYLRNEDGSRSELYDVRSDRDPYELNNLKQDPNFKSVINEMENALETVKEDFLFPVNEHTTRKYNGNINVFTPRQIGKPRRPIIDAKTNLQ